jgi:hypothetical protein
MKWVEGVEVAVYVGVVPAVAVDVAQGGWVAPGPPGLGVIAFASIAGTVSRTPLHNPVTRGSARSATRR